ncbi:Bug family tripartite tricarboxylate transporter substrate binding protein [Bordetella sp. 02P26C-1]|uniref:Bug family tripartite tricarboxylate transporter substrate binding protein n=1 Tax=Bordetella sp. 02P26C-1 TaxID=2683195 RepID=UPI00135512A1|nr:tripartite tricarboxylate transporter substrate binding protein [Bordetella sp. 02P26C-1]MVW79603.1 tripartite tricarboxylate transporter substrate binding protein [Bordetella sp. 02P26C-1]
MFRFKKTLTAAFAVLAISVVGSSAAATYPDKPIRIVVGFAPGGFTDVAARLVAEGLQKELGQPVIVENRPGATGTIGADAVARAAPDGYTLLLAHQNSNAVAPAMYPKLSYDVVKDFTPIARVASTALLLVVGPAIKAKTVEELVQVAKQQPGGLRHGSSGVGSSQHFGAAMFSQAVGVPMLHVPYKGSAQAVTDLLSGQIDINFDSPPPTLSFIQAGKLRALAITSDERSPLLPDVPTMAEVGVPGFEFTQWFGLVGPAGLPDNIVQTLNKALNAALTTPEVREKLISLGATPLGGTSEQFATVIKNDTKRFAELVKQLNISVE